MIDQSGWVAAIEDRVANHPAMLDSWYGASFPTYGFPTKLDFVTWINERESLLHDYELFFLFKLILSVTTSFSLYRKSKT